MNPNSVRYEFRGTLCLAWFYARRHGLCRNIRHLVLARIHKALWDEWDNNRFTPCVRKYEVDSDWSSLMWSVRHRHWVRSQNW